VDESFQVIFTLHLTLSALVIIQKPALSETPVETPSAASVAPANYAGELTLLIVRGSQV